MLRPEQNRQPPRSYALRAWSASLRVVAARLARAVRAQDLVCRLSGGSFACLLTDVSDREQIGRRARMLLEAIAVPILLGVHEVTLQPCIGIALWPAHGTGVDDLLDNAGAALPRARRKRCGYAFFK